METIPNLPMREKESPEHVYEAGRKYGEYQTKKELKIKMKNLAFNFFRDELAYDAYVKRIDELFA